MEVYKQIIITFLSLAIISYVFMLGMVQVYKNTPVAISPSFYMSCSNGFCSCNFNGEVPNELELVKICKEFIILSKEENK
jgi:hypothetical protein